MVERLCHRRQSLYLLLGSAALDPLSQSGETLAGRVACLELSPLNVLELITAADVSRGGAGTTSP
jgi:hypothetical protein